MSIKYDGAKVGVFGKMKEAKPRGGFASFLVCI